MHKKHLYIPLLLLNVTQTNSFPSRHWMSDMMREMEESFSRMHDMMEEAYSHASLHGSATKGTPRISMEIEKEPEHILLTLHNVNEGTVDAHFDEQVLRLQHPEVSAHIRQIRDRYNRTGISVLVESKVTVSQEEGNKKLKQSSYFSNAETIATDKPIMLDEPEITYDEEKKELSIKLMYKTQKTIPVNVKKAGSL